MRTIHLCLSVRGALNQTKAEMKRMAPSITVDGKQLRTADEVRNFLLDDARSKRSGGHCISWHIGGEL